MSNRASVGLTRDRGWEIGVRRTRPEAPEAVWAALMSSRGRALWLGIEEDEDDEPLVANAAYHWGEIAIAVISTVPGSMIRLIWHSDLLDFATMVQIRVLPAKTGATLSVLQDLLRSAEQREQMRAHWERVLEGVFALV